MSKIIIGILALTSVSAIADDIKCTVNSEPMIVAASNSRVQSLILRDLEFTVLEGVRLTKSSRYQFTIKVCKVQELAHYAGNCIDEIFSTTVNFNGSLDRDQGMFSSVSHSGYGYIISCNNK